MLLLACCLLSVSTVSFALEESTDIDLLPYIEDYPNGKIDWDAGLIYDVGRGYLHLNRGNKNFAMCTSRALAYQSILMVAAGVCFNDERTLKTLGAVPVKIHLKGLVSAKEHEKKFVEEPPQPYFPMIVRSTRLFSRKLSQSRRQFIMLRYFKCKLQANLEEIKISKYFVQL